MFAVLTGLSGLLDLLASGSEQGRSAPVDFALLVAGGIHNFDTLMPYSIRGYHVPLWSHCCLI